MAAPTGNRNAARAKFIRDAFSRALELHKPAEQRVALDAVVKSIIAKAMEGDIQAAKEIFDRIDGKSVQATEISGLDGGSIEISKIERIITDAANRNP